MNESSKNIILNKIKSIFKNAKYCKSRGHSLHIRITKFDSQEFEKFLIIFKYSILSHEKNSLYSTSYKTYEVKINDEIVPVVISEKNSKVSNKDSIIQKQLTPKKLNMTGNFISNDIFINQLSLNLEKNKPQLSSHWKSNNLNELSNVLMKLSKQAFGCSVSFTEREKKILVEHSHSIGKDFGEILAAAYILNKHGNVNLSEGESSANFDLHFYDDSGIINKFNTKSGSGSGQSFKSIKKELKSIGEDEYVKKSESAFFIDIIKEITTNSDTNGQEKMFNICDMATELNSELGLFFKDIKKIFFNDKKIDKYNYNINQSFYEYTESCLFLLNKYNLPILGLPKGTKERNPENIYSNDPNFKLNIILFFMLTNLSKNFNNNIVTNVMNKLLRTKIYILHVNIDSDGVNILIPKEITYKMHYWANCFSPTNNLLGFKSIY